jgi:predicted O-methyltransferase YrrM
MAEFGTGCGVGTAWLRSGVRGDARILTAELDPKLAGAAAEIFEDDPQVEVLSADWSTLLDKGPFSLLFLDSGEPTEVGVDSIADLVEAGGIVVLDDFTPCELWPPITYGRVDTLREQWLTDDRFTSVEVMVAPDASALIATKR